MPMSTQGKILRVLTDQSFVRVGGQRTVKVDMRVVSSTARNLPDEIAARALPRGPLLPAQRRAGAPAGARRRGARTFPRSSSISPPATPPTSACRRRASPMTPWRRCRPMTGRATSASCRNVIERTIILAPGERIGCIEIDMLPPEILNDQAQLTPNEAVKAIMGTPLQGGARDVRARISARPDPPLLRQHLAHRQFHRHGALGAAPQAEGARPRRHARGGERIAPMARARAARDIGAARLAPPI